MDFKEEIKKARPNLSNSSVKTYKTLWREERCKQL